MANRRTLGPNAIGLVLAIAAIFGTLAGQCAFSSAPSFGVSDGPSAEGGPPQSGSAPTTAVHEVPGGKLGRTLTDDDGVLPVGVTAFDAGYAGITNLDPDLLAAVRDATTDAAGGGIELQVTSGWRSPAYQRQLIREAVLEYGSEAEAARWVATVETSPHVSGDAIDIRPAEATAWLSLHATEYGLCQIYRNEPWHFELRPEAIDGRCPRMYADPPHDPRMQ